jgi:hypothetical protein
MSLKTERRTQLRKRPLSLVYVELPPSNGGMMRDLSEYGFSLRAMMPLQPSEKIPFSFALDTAARIDGEAIVRRLEDGGRVAALEFAGLPPHSRDQIRRWLEKFDEPISPEPESDSAQPRQSKHSSLTELRAQIRAPKPPSPAPPAAESAPPPPLERTTPPGPEAAVETVIPAVEATPLPPPPKIVIPSTPGLSPESAMPTVEETPLPPPKAAIPSSPEPMLPPVSQEWERPQPPLLQAAPAPPKLELPLPQEPPPPPSPAQWSTEAPPLPPLLKLSSVRPGPLPAEPVPPVAIPKPVPEPPAKIKLALPKMETPAAREEPNPAPPFIPSPATRRASPPALEPLSSIEAETDSDTPGWMDSFTLGRVIGIMLFLTLVAGSYVYHRELGQALIWLGHQIEGQDSPETSKVVRPEIPAPVRPIPEPSSSARAVPPPPLTIQQPPASNEPKGANLPPASDKTPTPQLKGPTPGALVPLTQVTRPPAPASPVDNSGETGQQEYLRALQILRTPSRASEVPAAVQLLWSAVEKGNTDAEIDLAELFRTGNGVAKNCDQTRILLTAAARKGNAEARKRVEALRREGCSD